MKKEYEVTEELADIMSKCVACEALRDKYVKIPFMHKRAVKAAYEAEKCRSDFWYGVYKLYPNLRGQGKKFIYHRFSRLIKEDKT